MNTQALQHALSQMLHNMQRQMADLTAAVSDVERRLKQSAHPGAAPARPSAPSSPNPGSATGPQEEPAQGSASGATGRSGGRRSAGWSDTARAEVAARMRDYWRRWREAKSDGALGQRAPQGEQPMAPKPSGGRSTAGWTPQARAQAAAA